MFMDMKRAVIRLGRYEREFFVSQTPPGNFIRLGYQAIPSQLIEPGIALLADALHSLRPPQ